MAREDFLAEAQVVQGLSSNPSQEETRNSVAVIGTVSYTHRLYSTKFLSIFFA